VLIHHAVFIFPPLLSVVAFVPAHTYGSHAYFWNLVSYAFVETNLLLFVVDALAILTFLPIFERMWGVTETACFFLASAACAALLLLLSIVAFFALTLDWSVLQVSIDVAVACAPLIFLETVRQRRPLPFHLRRPRVHRPDIPQRKRSCNHREKLALGLRRYHATLFAASVVSYFFFSLRRHAVVCCTLRVISGGMFEALLVLYGGAAGLIPLLVIQNSTVHTQRSNKNLVHARLFPLAGALLHRDACVRPSGWIYLRFFQVRGDYIVRGDASEVRVCAICAPSLRASVIARQDFSAASFFAWAPPLRALVLLLSPAAHRMCCCCMPLAAASLLPGQAPAALQPLPSVVQVGIASKLPDVSVSQAQRYRQRALLALRSRAARPSCDVHAATFETDYVLQLVRGRVRDAWRRAGLGLRITKLLIINIFAN
jgi:hypothetical protein